MNSTSLNPIQHGKLKMVEDFVMHSHYVDTPEALQQLCQQLQGATVVALDTEFMREKNYYSQFCLLQLATDKVIACVDPLAIDDLSPLMDVLYDEKILKVFHAAGQDLELFFDAYGKLPKPLFDTQIAAALLGHGNQTGYGNLVQSVLNVTLDKSHSRTDWSLRPLDSAQLEYAADDVRYLYPLYHTLVEELAKLGRSDWLADDFSELANQARYDKDDRLLWRRIRGANRLKPRQLAILRELAAWREQQARGRNKPRKWILADEVMLDIARHAPKDVARLARIRGLNESVVTRNGDKLLQLVKAGQAIPQEECPSMPKVKSPSTAQESQADLLIAVVRLVAAESSIAMASLANRKEVEALVMGEADSVLLQGWRGELLGKRLNAVLSGEQALHVHNGKVELVSI